MGNRQGSDRRSSVSASQTNDEYSKDDSHNLIKLNSLSNDQSNKNDNNMNVSTTTNHNNNNSNNNSNNNNNNTNNTSHAHHSSHNSHPSLLNNLSFSGSGNHNNHNNHNSNNNNNNGGSPKKRSGFGFGLFRSGNEHAVDPTFGNGIQMMCQSPNLIKLEPGIELNNTVITTKKRILLLSYGYIRMHGINPNDIATILSNYVDCYTSVYFQFNREKMKYHKARIMLIFKPEITLLTCNFLPPNIHKKSMRISIKMLENDCYYSWYKHNGYDIECGVIGIPKDDSNRFSRKFQKLKHDFVSFSQIHTKSSSFKSLQCYYLSCVRHSDANLTTCRVEMRGPNLGINCGNNNNNNNNNSNNNTNINEDLKNIITTNNNNDGRRESISALSTTSVGSFISNHSNAGSKRNSINLSRRLSKHKIVANDAKSNNNNNNSNNNRDEIMEESIIIYNRYKRAKKDHSPNVNRDYFWKIGDSVDICIDYDKENDKYFLYFLKNGKKLIAKPNKNNMHATSNDDDNDNDSKKRKNRKNRYDSNNKRRNSSFADSFDDDRENENQTWEEHKDRDLSYSNHEYGGGAAGGGGGYNEDNGVNGAKSPHGGYKDRLYYYRRHSSIGDLKQNIDELLRETTGGDAAVITANNNNNNNNNNNVTDIGHQQQSMRSVVSPNSKINNNNNNNNGGMRTVSDLWRMDMETASDVIAPNENDMNMNSGSNDQLMIDELMESGETKKSAFDDARIELNTNDYYYYAAITTVGCDCDDMKGFQWSVSLHEQINSPFVHN